MSSTGPLQCPYCATYCIGATGAACSPPAPLETTVSLFGVSVSFSTGVGPKRVSGCGIQAPFVCTHRTMSVFAGEITATACTFQFAANGCPALGSLALSYQKFGLIW